MIGKNITYWRESKGLTQEDLAEAIGATQPIISRWESGRVEPKIKVLLIIAGALGVSIDDLVKEEK